MFTEEKTIKKQITSAHNITLENRNKMFISGVEDVENFNEKNISIMTTNGAMEISGEELHIESLNLDIGEVSVTGHIGGIEYKDGIRSKSGFWSKVFG